MVKASEDIQGIFLLARRVPEAGEAGDSRWPMADGREATSVPPLAEARGEGSETMD